MDKILQSFKANHRCCRTHGSKSRKHPLRFGGKVFLIDTGMLASYYPGGRASALEIQNNVKFTAEYMDGQVVLLEPARVSLVTGGSEEPPQMWSAEWILTGFSLSAVLHPADR